MRQRLGQMAASEFGSWQVIAEVALDQLLFAQQNRSFRF
jgi:hypothetical protein